MIPIHELLNRIRWDKEFAEGDFEIGYHDRVRNTTLLVGFREVYFPERESGVFEVVDEDDRRRRIPFHRVREVYRDGELIWKRSGVHPRVLPR